MQVVNGLTGIIIGVGDDTEAALFDALCLRHRTHRIHDGHHILRGDTVSDVVVMILRHDEHMDRHHRIQIPESEHAVILIDFRRGDIPGNDLTEDAIILRHGRPPQALERVVSCTSSSGAAAN